MDKLLKKLDDSFDRLQNLDIKCTLGNMEKLVQTLYDLRDVYKELKKMNMEAKTDGGQTADTE